MALFRYLHDVEMAWESIRSGKLRSALTALGIVFGVAAVISMLAIGNGAQKELLEQMRRIGVNIVVIEAVKPSEAQAQDDQEAGEEAHKRFSSGLSMRDVEAIRQLLPTVRRISPEVQYEEHAQSGSVRMKCQIVGVQGEFFSIYNLPMAQGTALSEIRHQRAAVCVIGSEVRARLFGRVDPLGQRLRIRNAWFEVIGVLARGGHGRAGDAALGISSHDTRVFVGAEALSLRLRRRGLLVGSLASWQLMQGRELNEADRIIIQVDEPEHLASTCEVLHRLLLRLHQQVEDFKLIVPEALLLQQQRTKDIFNLVLGLIAGISLLVGGIGIMNIMFATVLERTREIGMRLAIGAKRQDVVVQFLAEAVFISVGGGCLGVLLGLALSAVIERVASIDTVVTPGAILVAFGVSVTVGIFFGYAPARRAARRSPIDSLRYE